MNAFLRQHPWKTFHPSNLEIFWLPLALLRQSEVERSAWTASLRVTAAFPMRSSAFQQAATIVHLESIRRLAHRDPR